MATALIILGLVGQLAAVGWALRNAHARVPFEHPYVTREVGLWVTGLALSIVGLVLL